MAVSNSITTDTTAAFLDQYAVFGNPVAHSLSPRIHALFAEQTQQAMHYSAQHIPQDHFNASVRAFFDNGGCGLNITVPFKSCAFELADRLSKRARTAGAVNTLWQKAGVMYGDNTDGVGLINDLTFHHGMPLQGKRILVLGAGGAARGVLEPLLAENPEAIVIANRTTMKAEQLARAFSKQGNISGTGFDSIDGSFDVVINGTSAQLSGQRLSIPAHVLTMHTFCYDMMYTRDSSTTAFLQWAEYHDIPKAQCADGLGMLIYQAAEAFTLWRNKPVDALAVFNALNAERHKNRAT